VLAPACSSSSGSSAPPSDAGADATTGAQALWIAPTSLSQLADTHFYDHPWPSDLRRAADGTVVFTGFYNPRLVPLITQVLGQISGLLDGFSPAAAMYLRFTGDIDPSTLPVDPPHSLLPTSTVPKFRLDALTPKPCPRTSAWAVPLALVTPTHPEFAIVSNKSKQKLRQHLFVITWYLRPASKNRRAHPLFKWARCSRMFGTVTKLCWSEVQERDSCSLPVLILSGRTVLELDRCPIGKIAAR